MIAPKAGGGTKSLRESRCCDVDEMVTVEPAR